MSLGSVRIAEWDALYGACVSAPVSGGCIAEMYWYSINLSELIWHKNYLQSGGDNKICRDMMAMIKLATPPRTMGSEAQIESFRSDSRLHIHFKWLRISSPSVLWKRDLKPRVLTHFLARLTLYI
jgi:hypothetical protein